MPLAASGVSASPLVCHDHRHARTATCFAFLPTDFRGKETPFLFFFKLLALKVVAVTYERWSLTRGSKI